MSSSALRNFGIFLGVGAYYVSFKEIRGGEVGWTSYLILFSLLFIVLPEWISDWRRRGGWAFLQDEWKSFLTYTFIFCAYFTAKYFDFVP